MDCYRCIVVNRDFIFGKRLLTSLDHLVAHDATGDGTKWQLSSSHGRPIGTVDWATLKELGLRRRDSRIASDHMPIVVDVSWD